MALQLFSVKPKNGRVLVQRDCHPEQAFSAQRRACPELVEGIWAGAARLLGACPERATATEGRVWLASLSDLAFLRDLRESFAIFAVKGSDFAN
jgi:hypothetical protein